MTPHPANSPASQRVVTQPVGSEITATRPARSTHLEPASTAPPVRRHPLDHGVDVIHRNVDVPLRPPVRADLPGTRSIDRRRRCPVQHRHRVDPDAHLPHLLVFILPAEQPGVERFRPGWIRCRQVYPARRSVPVPRQPLPSSAPILLESVAEPCRSPRTCARRHGSLMIPRRRPGRGEIAPVRGAAEVDGDHRGEGAAHPGRWARSEPRPAVHRRRRLSGLRARCGLRPAGPPNPRRLPGPASLVWRRERR